MSLNKSKGNMYSWTDFTWNPIRGKCPHRCVYCLGGETLILMSNLSFKKLEDIEIGDSVMGVKKGERYKHLEEAIVENKMKRETSAISIKTEHTSAICSRDHRWLIDRRRWRSNLDGLKVSMGIKILNKYLHRDSLFQEPVHEEDNYKKGYLRGMILGDGMLKKYRVKEQRIKRHGREYIYSPKTVYKFRLSLKDREALNRTKEYLNYFGQNVFEHIHSGLDSIRKDGKQSYRKINELIEPIKKSRFMAGFLGGFFDAEGSFSCGILRISNKKIGEITTVLDYFGFKYHKRKANNNVYSITITGGFDEHIRFFNIANPAITRKRKRFLKAIKYGYSKILSIEPVGFKELYDIQTTTGNFIANGLISHNCFMKDRDVGALRLDEKVLEDSLGTGRTIFVGSSTDMWADAVPGEWICQVLNQCRHHDGNKYIFQSKNPRRFFQFIEEFPQNIILGTTLESNRQYGQSIHAPPPWERAATFVDRRLQRFKKMVSIEPIVAFELEVFSRWLKEINPAFVSIGADSKGHNLIEPTSQELKELISELSPITEIKLKENLNRLLEPK